MKCTIKDLEEINIEVSFANLCFGCKYYRIIDYLTMSFSERCMCGYDVGPNKYKQECKDYCKCDSIESIIQKKREELLK